MKKAEGEPNPARPYMEEFEKFEAENRRMEEYIRSIKIQHEEKLKALKGSVQLEAPSSSARQTRNVREDVRQPGQLTQNDICKQHAEIVAGFRDDVYVLLNCFTMLSVVSRVCEEKLFFIALLSVAGVALLISLSCALLNMHTTKKMSREVMETNTRRVDWRVSTAMLSELMMLIAYFLLTSMCLIYIGVHSCSKHKGAKVPPNSILPLLLRGAY